MVLKLKSLRKSKYEHVHVHTSVYRHIHKKCISKLGLKTTKRKDKILKKRQKQNRHYKGN